jgi:hypothetical protein
MLFPEQTHQPTYNSDNLSSTITQLKRRHDSYVDYSILAQPRVSTEAPDRAVVSNNVRCQREVARTPCSQANEPVTDCIRGWKINTFYTQLQLTFRLYEIWTEKGLWRLQSQSSPALPTWARQQERLVKHYPAQQMWRRSCRRGTATIEKTPDL